MALALTSATWFAIPAFSLPADLEGEVSAVKAENAALREQLRKIEDQQRALMELITQLQKRLDGAQIADAPRAAPPPVPTQISDFSVPFTGAAPFSKPFTARPSSGSVPPTLATQETGSRLDRPDDRYKDGFVLVETDDASGGIESSGAAGIVRRAIRRSGGVPEEALRRCSRTVQRHRGAARIGR
jgi:hypothetical protein